MKTLATLLAATLAMLSGCSDAEDGSWIAVENQPCQIYQSVPPEPRTRMTVTWSGACVDGKTSGRGREVWRSSDPSYDGVFEGEHRAGKRHGHGIRTWSSGNRYEGEYRDGELRDGVATAPDGTRYEGEWRDGKPHGHGVVTWSDGERYEGEIRAGMFHGRGVQTLSNGERYEGEFRDDERHGHGVYTWRDGSRYEGEWRNDKTLYDGGVHICADGTRIKCRNVDCLRACPGSLSEELWNEALERL